MQECLDFGCVIARRGIDSAQPVTNLSLGIWRQKLYGCANFGVLPKGVLRHLLEQVSQLASAVSGQIGSTFDVVGRIRQSYGNAVLERELVDDRTDGRDPSNLPSLQTECVAPEL
ncbi:hypothetical protein PITCH_A50052 [uncultured Desulfobacterium sp.]|uniref:Uncharacterized protein n=1 Tax=uncultured Desulfobacterium sp. TaxID=201089 RepID=A0A445N0I2_9BACT|nr:hypothetical protein PITCH_A50052 [uncultured Desulfobacterium sp.]